MFVTTVIARARNLAAAGAAALACSAALGAPAAQAAPVNCGPVADQVPTAANLAQINAATICLMNNERDARGLVRLAYNQKLFDGAQRHNNDMVTRHFFSHTGSDGSTPVTRLSPYYTGASSWNVAENITWASGSSSTPRGRVISWMNSAGHRANILNAALREVAVAARAVTPAGAVGGTYTATFGRSA